MKLKRRTSTSGIVPRPSLAERSRRDHKAEGRRSPVLHAFYWYWGPRLLPVTFLHEFSLSFWFVFTSPTGSFTRQFLARIMFIVGEMRNTAAMTHQRREARTPQLQPNAPTAHGHGRVFRAWDEVSDHASSTTSPPLPLATAHKVLSAWDERPHQPQPEYPSSASFNREHQQVPSSFLLRRLYQGEAQTTGCAVVRWCVWQCEENARVARTD